MITVEFTKYMSNQRLLDVYNRLVDEMENPATLHNERKSHLLRKLLDLVEYVMEFDHTNPLDEWFNDDEPNAVAPNDLWKVLSGEGTKYPEGQLPL